jgi:hypothetical protein
VRFPRSTDSYRSDLARSSGTQAPGSRRNLSQELRSRVSDQDVARMQRTAGEAKPTYRSAPVSRSAILDRYRHNSSTPVSGAPSSGAPSSGTPSSGTQARAGLSDQRTARRAAAETAGPSRARRESSRLERTSAGRTGAEKSALAARRTTAARDAKNQSNDRRVNRARENYLASVKSSVDSRGGANGGNGGRDGNGGGNGNGDGHDNGYDHGYDDGYGHGYDDGYGYGHGYGYYGGLYHSYWGSYWGHGYYGWNWGLTAWAWGYWWDSYWYNGGYWNYGGYPSYYWYGPFYPVQSSIIIQVGDTSDEDVIYAYDEGTPAGEVVDPAAQEPSIPVVVPEPAGSGELNRAADYYLTLGDRSFRDGRFGDSVHFYAKAVEYAPEEGILYLILSDSLFASGDYHYAAFALRKAFELDPALSTNVLDKHSFYADPAEFDRQLAVLESYLEDHFLDDDARLVLGANYLFGGRPAAAVDLLENAFSLEVKRSAAGQRILEAAKAIQYGVPSSEGAPR